MVEWRKEVVEDEFGVIRATTTSIGNLLTASADEWAEIQAETKRLSDVDGMLANAEADIRDFWAGEGLPREIDPKISASRRPSSPGVMALVLVAPVARPGRRSAHAGCRRAA